MNPDNSFTIRQAIVIGQNKLRDLEESSLIIYSILGYVLSYSQAQLWQHMDNYITREDFKEFSTLIDRAARHEPLAYILGYADFYNLRFTVTPDTLIPRPESEQIIELALDIVPHPHIIVDVGTGSGCLALTLAHHLPKSLVYGIDISTRALKVAKSNQSRHNIHNVTWLTGSLLEPLSDTSIKPGSIDLIVANLPYISDEEFEALPDNVKFYEPSLALKSGTDPDVINRQLIQQSKQWLSPTGRLIYETTNGKIVQM